MRRICLYLMASFIFFCFSFGICPKIMAYDAPTSLPFAYAGYTFTDYIADNGGSIMYYNSSGSPPYSFSYAYGSNYGLPDNIYYGWGVASPALLYYYGCTDFKNCSTVNIYTDSNSHCFGGVYFNSQDIYAYPPNNNVLVFQANPYSFTSLLTVNLNPVAGGTVASSPGSLTCLGNTCTGSFSGSIPLTATSSSNWSFGFWDDGTLKSADNPLSLNMTSDKTLEAKFYHEMKMPLPANKHWVLSVEAGGNRQCNLSPDTYHSGNSFYALDFVDYTEEDGHLEVTDVPILAAAGGIVTESSCSSPSWGCTVVIDHNDGFSTRYAHMKTTPLVSVNDTPTRGQQIGIMGDTGNSDGIHLHFQIYYGGNSSSTNAAVKAVTLDGRKLDDYKVSTSTDCNAAKYLSTNSQ